MKFIKRIITTLLIIALLGVSYIELSGNRFLYKTLGNTIFKGRLGPTIDDYNIFPHRVVKAGNYQAWPVDTLYNQFDLSEDELNIHEKYETVSLVAIKSGKLIFERYWQGYSDSSKTNSWSMTKSLIGHLLAVAIYEGQIGSLQDQVSKYIPMYQSDSITLESLVTMSSGIDFDESYLNPLSYPARSLFDDDIKAIHKKYKSTEKAGQYYSYQSGNTQLLAFVIESATGMSVSEYASKMIWKPLGARYDAIWSLDSEGGMEKAFCCFNSNARDFARFGQLYLQKGVWKGDTMISQDFHQKVTVPSNLKIKSSGQLNGRYSYSWWTVNYKNKSVYYCRGINGQYIFVVPEDDLVLVRLGRKRDSDKSFMGHPIDVKEYLDQAIRIGEFSN
jgi:CubicO group peptidase (beta-lactamase class C family)